MPQFIKVKTLVGRDNLLASRLNGTKTIRFRGTGCVGLKANRHNPQASVIALAVESLSTDETLRTNCREQF